MNSCLIINGTVCNADASFKADVAITDGIISEVGNINHKKYPGVPRLNAKGKLIFPGGIDPHVHLSLPTPAGPSSDDFLSGSRAALSGGTTSFIDFVTPRRGQSLIEALNMRRKEASASLCDWKLHMGISEWNRKVAGEVLICMREKGIHSFKAYLAYRKSIGISAGDLRQLMELVGAEGGIVLVHCEDGEMIENLTSKLLSEGKTRANYHALARPKEAELKSIREVIALSEATGCEVYIVHTSCSEGARLIGEAKEKGLRVHGETCIQYLILDDEVYEPELPEMEILPFVISPPLRDSRELDQLWRELRTGSIDTVATDHCPFNLYGQKDRGVADFTRIPNGAGGIEYRLSLLYTYGVLARFINMEQFVALTSTHAAGLFGWSGRKGRIEPGFDADLVVWNPDIQGVIRLKTQVQHCDSNIYEGIPVQGAAEMVFRQGVSMV